MKIRNVSGSGWDYCNKNGKYQINWGYGNNTKYFTDFIEAKKFYDSINEDKAFWDITRLSELIEVITYKK